MDVPTVVARAAVLASVILFLVAIDANAQFGVPFARYRTFETEHFILTFEAGLEDYARRAAARAEAAHPRLARAYGSTPRGKIRLVIVDQGDLFNGSATPAPTNRIVAFAHTPVGGDLLYTGDPIDLLVTHELAHVFHLDEARRGWRVLRGAFGRSDLTFPHFFDGSYLIEGLATFYESRLTDGGRVRGARFPETLRAWLLETQGPQLDEAESDPGAWPLDRHYVLGSLFFEHVADRYGEHATPAWMARRAGSFGSIVSRGAGVGDLFGGRSLSPARTTDWLRRAGPCFPSAKGSHPLQPPVRRMGTLQPTGLCPFAPAQTGRRRLRRCTTEMGRPPILARQTLAADSWSRLVSPETAASTSEGNKGLSRHLTRISAAAHGLVRTSRPGSATLRA